MAALPVPDDPNLLAGARPAEDAAVYKVTADLAVVATVDFFTPIVDDPTTYGRVAAYNALSDIYAMGANPLLALSVVGFPYKELDDEVLVAVVRGGAEACAAEGVALAGGHTVRAPELLFGLAVVGTAHPARVVTKGGVRPGDALVLTKALGTGVISTAVKAGDCPEDVARGAEASMLTSNRLASAAMVAAGARGATDVTGFGLLGHAWEMAEASAVGLRFFASRVPTLPGALAVAERYIPGGLYENKKFVAPHLKVAPDVGAAMLNLLHDPQTSGGLLIALPADRARALAAELGPPAAVVGEAFAAPAPTLEVVN